MSEDGVITFVGVAHPWMCDAMGHMNVRHYAAMFDDASFQLLGQIGGPEQTGLGWADAKLEIEFRHETTAGTLLTIRSHVEKIGNSSISYAHVMRGTLDGVLHATARTVTVRFDLQARSKAALDAELRTRADALILKAG